MLFTICSFRPYLYNGDDDDDNDDDNDADGGDVVMI